MTIIFKSSNSLEHRSVYRAIYNYAKEKGYDVSWGVGGKFTVSSDSVSRTTILMPHGVSVENFFAIRRESKRDPFGYLLPGPYWKQYFNHSSPPQVPSRWIDGLKRIPAYPEGKLKVVGWPKSDLLFSTRRKQVKERWLDELSLPYNKTVLCGHPLYGLGGCKGLAEITKSLEVNLIYKLHWTADVQWLHKRRKECEGFKHVNWVDPTKLEDITELFLVSDLLISDSSSSIETEFMVTGKPVISIPNEMVSGFFVEEDKSPAVCCTEDGIKEAIIHCIEKPDELKKQQEAWLEKMIYKPDGNASKRAWEAIMELIKT